VAAPDAPPLGALLARAAPIVNLQADAPPMPLADIVRRWRAG
jgi:hypothetical protein